MTGLEKIVQQIRDEAQQAADAVIAQAKEEAGQLAAKAAEDARTQSGAILAKSKTDVQNHLAAARSARRTGAAPRGARRQAGDHRRSDRKRPPVDLPSSPIPIISR